MHKTNILRGRREVRIKKINKLMDWMRNSKK